MSTQQRTTVACLLSLGLVVGGCAAKTTHLALPPVDAPPAQVARALVAAYQAGDGPTLRKLCGGRLWLHPGDLGRITNVHWGIPFVESAGRVNVPFRADTTGSPDGTIPAEHSWSWSFILERRSPGSRWLEVDQGQG